MSINKIEMQDTNGNALYPHTSGDLVNYDSTKTVVQKIDEAMTNLASLKSSLATAINNKAGSSLNSSSTLADITAKINSIVTLSSGTNDATATASQILNGSTAYIKGNKIAGSMTNNGAVAGTVNCGGSYTIPAGYHNGSGKVTGNSLASQTSATAATGQILSGQTAYVNGNKVTGTMPNKGSYADVTSWTPYNSNMFFRFPAGYYSGGSYANDTKGGAECAIPMTTITRDLGITADKIVSGNTILGVAGTATIQSMGGMKIATGQVTSSSTRDRSFVLYQLSGSTTTLASLVISGLSFRPKYAMFYATDRFSWRSVCIVDTLATIGGKLGGMFTATNGTDVSTSGSNCPYQDNTWMITDNGIIAGTSMTSTAFNYVIVG